ncbi:MAG TPA: hypothetical protein DDZ66_02865 [Firmicutes bacterium]|nr:hypothetical protein [Bacillota bacterium]HBT18115.1 hypothetical protein [Bacillota bacterium]
MEPKHLGALALILFGGYFLANNLGILPSSNVFWPVVLIVLGLVALYQNSSRPKKTVTDDGEVIFEIDGNSAPIKALVAIPTILVVVIVSLVILGVLGPFFILSLAFIPIVLFLKLGWAFFRLLVPILFGAAPLLLLLGLLMLIF